jgi:hypothetical protein
VGDIDTAAMDSLKVLDPERPIREADIVGPIGHVRKVLPGSTGRRNTRETECQMRSNIPGKSP